MSYQQTIFQSNDIEFSTDGDANRRAIITGLGHLFQHVGYSLIRHADDPDMKIPESFDLIREVEGWDMRFKLKLNLKEPEPPQ